MQLESAEDLIHALRVSGLFTEEQLEAIVRELAALDAAAGMKRLVRAGHVTFYQLKKVRHGKAADLFVGPYVVTDKIGEGGMGKVFRARRLAGGAGQVALKVVRPALVASATVRGRFAREVQAVGALAHPNIVRLFDAGDADGKFYLAMEFVDGVDLGRLVETYGALEVAEACEYARQVALGLGHAHARGFVHRDVKPSNFMVAGERHLPQATEPALVKMLDLGLTRAMVPDDMVAPNLTRDHALVGTPDYMAPEQAKNSKRADPRCDLYGLGCTMYFLLTGRVPFEHPAAVDKIVAHQSEVPPPLQALRPEVAAGVAQLVARLMAKEPGNRIQTAAEVADALAGYAKYAPDAQAVPVRPRDRALRDAEEPWSGTPGHGEATSVGSSAASSVGASSTPLSLGGRSRDAASGGAHLEPLPLAEELPPVLDLAGLQEAAGTERAFTPASAPRRSKRAARKPKRRQVPQLLWAAVALVGVGILALMLWLMQNR